jgi:hypothetical protein
VSVGHVARVVEEAGIPTVGVYVKGFAQVAKDMALPRVLVTRHPIGRPLGAPRDAERQTDVIRSALKLLDAAEAGSTLAEFPEPYRPRPS